MIVWFFRLVTFSGTIMVLGGTYNCPLFLLLNLSVSQGTRLSLKLYWMEITKMSDPSDSLRQHSAVGLVYTKLQVKFYHMCSACDLAIHPACSKNLLDQSGTLSSIKVYEYPSPYTLVCPIAEHVHLLLLRQKIP